MMNVFQIIVLAPIFIILLVVIYHTVWSAFDFDKLCSIILSACVSLLAVIGIDYFLKDSTKLILLPYAALAIAILLMLLLSFIGKHFKEPKDHLSDYYTIYKDGAAQTDNKKFKKLR